MPVQYGRKHKVQPTAILNGRAALAYVDDVAIMITNVDKWTDTDTIRMLEESTRLGGGISAPGAVTHFFGETMGNSASQRKLIVDWMEKHGIEPTPRTITLTDSALMRAALLAYSWLTKTEMKAFATRELEQACTWLTRDLDTDPVEVKAAVLGCYKLIGKTP